MSTDAKELIGIVVLVFVLKELFPFLLKIVQGKNGHSAGGQPVDFWQGQIRTAVNDAMVLAMVPIFTKQTAMLDRQTDILDELKDASKRHADALTENKFKLEAVKEDTGHTRSNMHGLREDVQSIVSRIPMPKI